ncbi:CHAP domain-containing protein [Bradyrhizobium sp. SSUT77]|uniref:CHAP domain-containing protein n=1 Tax=Bradyrhizobium sp. SSUT77 TaxID=3040603 RepID=UPI00244BFB6E|nr:CHAP domain-containing protein [Bradyrhizobium sp. SSUT77]MDH2348710.1 CHAP domain-containing protein [Bradyrhizobium sp. SSUT77]
MPTHVATQDKVQEEDLLGFVQDARDIDEADVVTAVRDKDGTFTVESTVIVVDKPTGMVGTPIIKKGKMSHFGGPNDPGVSPTEGLSLFDESDIAANPDIFLPAQPPNTTGLARRPDPDVNYIACRWDFSATPRSFLRKIKVRVSANGKTEEARPVDFGPSLATGRVADLSPGLERKLGLVTDQECTVEIPPPQVGVAVGVNLAAIDKVIFPSDMTRSLIVMTTSNNSTYWVVNQIGVVEGGQTLLRRVGSDAPEILLSNTTVFPVEADDEIPQAVADQLNKASTEPAKSKKQGGPAPSATTDVNAKVFAKAKGNVGLDTSKVAGTDNGNLACAWAVNEIVRLALGKPIAADSKGRNALGTGQVFDALRKHHIQTDNPSPGSIIVSPTPPSGSVHGHIGIVGQSPTGDFDKTQVFSNSSAQAQFAQNRTFKTWKERYVNQLHLPMLFFDLDKSQF